MKKLYNRFFTNKNIFSPLLIILLGGIIGTWILATALLLLALMFMPNKTKTDFLFVLLLLVFFLGDAFNGPLSFAQNFRFVVLGLALLYLFRYRLIINNAGNYMLPFTLVALIISLLFSPVGVMSVLRAIAFWLVAAVVFKLYTLAYKANSQRTLDLIVLVITLYFGMTLLFVFLPGFSIFQMGRLKGFMGNPNGMGMLAMFCYAVLSLINGKNETTFKNSFFLKLKGLLLVFIILSGSRTALFSVLVFEIIVRLMHNKPLLILSLLTTVYIYLLINSFGFESVIDFFGLSDYLRVDSLQNASGRTDVWPVAWEEIKSNPWVGKGILYDDYFIKDYVVKNFGESPARQWGGIWSSYLSLLLDVGIIGMLVYVFFYLKMYIKAVDKKMALGFILLCAFSGITESWMASSMNAFTPLMFLFWAIELQPNLELKKQI